MEKKDKKQSTVRNPQLAEKDQKTNGDKGDTSRTPQKPKTEPGGQPSGLLEKVTEAIEEKTGMDRQAIKDAAIHTLEKDAMQAANTVIKQGMRRFIKDII